MSRMRIDAMLAERRPLFSFEFFPPETPEATERLYDTIAHLRELEPAFVSVTCRNHSRERTLELVTHIKERLGIEPMAHYTCAGATVEELHTVLRGLHEAGIDNVLALGGDPPKDAPARVDGGLAHASELAALIRDSYDLCIGGACYPEVHPAATSAEDDLRYALLKVESGASFLITQMFFENRHYFDFVARARRAGIDVPIIPGIMPITTLGRLDRARGTLFDAHLPEALLEALDRRVDDPAAITALGTAYATLQCSELLGGGAPGVHFYTLNRSPATRAILSALLVSRPWERAGQL